MKKKKISSLFLFFFCSAKVLHAMAEKKSKFTGNASKVGGAKGSGRGSKVCVWGRERCGKR